MGKCIHYLKHGARWIMIAALAGQKTEIDRLMCPILTVAEGFVLGVGAKMFTIVGPVIVYGTVASVVYGVIYWIIQMI